LLIWADPLGTGLGPAAPAGIFTDNLNLATWLWETFNSRWEPLLGHGLEETDPQPAQFVEVAAPHEHRLTCRSGEVTIDLVWREPLPSRWTETFPYEYRATAVIVPCLKAASPSTEWLQPGRYGHTRMNSSARRYWSSARRGCFPEAPTSSSSAWRRRERVGSDPGPQ